MPNQTEIMSCSVRILRSHDYCHFEITLGSVTDESTSIEAVDELRKTAARLADKAVEQYKIAKREAERQLTIQADRQYLGNLAQRIRMKPELERTVREQAELKAFDDKVWAENRNYDYQDDFEEQT